MREVFSVRLLDLAQLSISDYFNAQVSLRNQIADLRDPTTLPRKCPSFGSAVLPRQLN